MNEYTFDFNQQIKMSHGVALSFDFRQILLDKIPSAIDIVKASESEDRAGTDWWVERLNNKPLSIDLKARAKDYKRDDLALEIWSVIESEVIGWTRDITKATDYILWFWEDTKKYCLIPFPMLCYVFTSKWEQWQQMYKTAKQFTPKDGGGWHSECVFVPIKVVWDTIITEYS